MAEHAGSSRSDNNVTCVSSWTGRGPGGSVQKHWIQTTARAGFVWQQALMERTNVRLMNLCILSILWLFCSYAFDNRYVMASHSLWVRFISVQRYLRHLFAKCRVVVFRAILKQCRTLKRLNCVRCPHIPRFWAQNLEGGLLAQLYRVVNEGIEMSEFESLVVRWRHCTKLLALAAPTKKCIHLNAVILLETACINLP